MKLFNTLRMVDGPEMVSIEKHVTGGDWYGWNYVKEQWIPNWPKTFNDLRERPATPDSRQPKTL